MAVRRNTETARKALLQKIGELMREHELSYREMFYVLCQCNRLVIEKGIKAKAKQLTTNN